MKELCLIRDVHGWSFGKRVYAGKGAIFESKFQYNRNGIRKKLYESNAKKDYLFLIRAKKDRKFEYRADK